MILLALALCTVPACSDDPGEPCNQTIAWEAVSPQPETYEVGRAASFEGTPETCLIVNGALTEVDLTATSCLDDRDRQVIRVRACNGGACGGWSNPVTYEPTSCLEVDCEDGGTPGGFCRIVSQCERPCCPGSAYYLPERYEPCP